MRRYQAAFIAAWSLERIADAASTRELLELGAVERNALARSVLEGLGATTGLAVWGIATITLGIALALLVPRALSWALKRRRYMTSIDEALIGTYGVHGVSKIILAIALALGALGPLLNSLCLIRLWLLQH